MENKTHTVAYILLTVLLLSLIVLLYIYAQVIWQNQTEPIAVEENTSNGLTAAERQAILNQPTEPVDEVPQEEREIILNNEAKIDTRTPDLTQKERQAILNQ